MKRMRYNLEQVPQAAAVMIQLVERHRLWFPNALQSGAKSAMCYNLEQNLDMTSARRRRTYKHFLIFHSVLQPGSKVGMMGRSATLVINDAENAHRGQGGEEIIK